jgi:hypothetical protein
MKISPGWWLVYVSSIYVIVGMVNIFIYQFCEFEHMQFAYLVILGLPLYIPMLGRWVGVKTFWSK